MASRPRILLLAAAVTPLAICVLVWILAYHSPEPDQPPRLPPLPRTPSVPTTPPPPPLPTRPPRPPGWQPPTWPTASAKSAGFTPEFAVTDWSFPNVAEVFDFYWDAPAHNRLSAASGSAQEMRALATSAAEALATSCGDSAVAAVIRNHAKTRTPLIVPVLLHRIRLAGRPVWVLVSGWEYLFAGVPASAGHIRIDLYETTSALLIDSTQCG